jgi:hypothetical protein
MPLCGGCKGAFAPANCVSQGGQRRLTRQAHRAIKRRCAAMVEGFKSFASAAIPWPASNLLIGYARDNSHSGAVDIITSGHSSKSGIEHSHSTSRGSESSNVPAGPDFRPETPISSAFNATVPAGQGGGSSAFERLLGEPMTTTVPFFGSGRPSQSECLRRLTVPNIIKLTRPYGHWICSSHVPVQQPLSTTP